VGRVEAVPGASNVIAGEARASLDVRHAIDAQRIAGVDRILSAARDITRRRELTFEWSGRQEHRAVTCDPDLVLRMEKAVERAGFPLQRMTSGAGHDAMILAQRVPVAMLFLRSPGGISHHPDERVLSRDVAAALQTGLHFLAQLEELHG
jgi:allantoate deiminase